MKLSAQQNQLLKQYLNGSLQYRETYEEVYDHVISAIEIMPEDANFENAVNEIIYEDFGGYHQLTKLENRAIKAAVISGLKKYGNYFSAYLKWPGLLSTIVGAMCVYFAITQLQYVPIVLERIFILLCICPRLIALFRYFQTGYLFKDSRKSIKDNIFSKISHLPVSLFLIYFLWPNRGDRFNLGSINPVILTTLFMLAILYTLSLFKLYKDEFKVKLLEN